MVNRKIVNNPMPTQQPRLSYTTIRNYAERFSWTENGILKQGINPPPHAVNIQRVPYYVKYLTSKGILEEGLVITLKVFPEEHQRMIQFVKSQEIRRIRDYLIIEIDGHRFITH